MKKSKRQARHKSQPRSGNRFARLWLEPLEHRTLPSVSLLGVPNFEPQGPSPITDGPADVPNNEVVGAINAVATNSKGLLVGTVDGGIWRTSNPQDALKPDLSPIFPPPPQVQWTDLTSQYPSLSISSLQIAPGSVGTVVYAGIGDTSS